MDDKIPVDVALAIQEYAEIARCFEQAGMQVTKVEAPSGCQDGVYTANWALIAGNKAIMANLPNIRQAEEPYARKVLEDLGYQTVKLPSEVRFSGQGDALPCGKYLFVGTSYRTSASAHPLLARETGLEVIGVQTIPKRDDNDSPVINSVTGWPDSFFYDLDLALAVIRPDLIAWCPEAFEPESAQRIRNLQDIETIEVSLEEAMHGFACNLVSTGESVVMSNHAPELKKALQDRGLTVYTPEVTELLKGGGFIRCTSLTLS
jgi:N-dimethylarginine dimethylaminohydrolase